MRTRLRRLLISARPFTWRAEIHHVQGAGDCHRCLRVRAWGAGKTGQALQADLLSLSWGSPWGPCATDGAYPTPADVRALITYALANGWAPDHRGGTFLLSEHEPFSLPDFLLTDRLRSPTAADPTPRVIAAYEARQPDTVTRRT